jgi:hypothetical protein
VIWCDVMEEVAQAIDIKQKAEPVVWCDVT